MASERDASAPLMWVTGPARNNVIVLTDDTLFVATVVMTELARIDKALEEGVPANELLPAKAWKIALDDIERVQYRHVRIVINPQMVNRDATVYYHDGKKSRSLTIQFANTMMRDEVVKKLTGRLGRWPMSEEDVPAWRILAKYLWTMLVIVVLTLFFSGVLMTGVVTEAPVVIAWYINLCGIWSCLPPGFFAFIAALIAGILQLRMPPVIVTYEPDK